MNNLIQDLIKPPHLQKIMYKCHKTVAFAKDCLGRGIPTLAKQIHCIAPHQSKGNPTVKGVQMVRCCQGVAFYCVIFQFSEGLLLLLVIYLFDVGINEYSLENRNV